MFIWVLGKFPSWKIPTQNIPTWDIPNHVFNSKLLKEALSSLHPQMRGGRVYMCILLPGRKMFYISRTAWSFFMKVWQC